MKLTDKKIKSLKPDAKQKKVSDGKGLYLLVHPNGSKYWKLKYRINKKEKTLSIGVYPEVTLGEARDKAYEARKKIADNVDPSEEKRLKKLTANIDNENSFEAVAREWHKTKALGWTERHGRYVLRRLELDAFPLIGSRAINSITAQELLAVLRVIEKREALDVAKRIKQTCGQVFRYAVATGRAERDVSIDLQGALKVRKKTNYSSLKEDELPEFLQTLENYKGEYQTKLALKLIILTMVRTKELIGARWEEIDFNDNLWRIPAERMKMGKPHIVPLSKQAIEILKELEKLNGDYEFVFPSRFKTRYHINNDTILSFIYGMGYKGKTTTHGFRHTASTILNENGFNSDYIEKQLSHGDRNTVRATYNHAQHIPERREMLQWYADFIDKQRELKDG